MGEAAEPSRVRYLRLPRRRRARARVPLKKFAMLEATMLILALVESGVPFAGERRVVGARRPGGVAVHLVDRDPAEVVARERCHRPHKQDHRVARSPWKMRRMSSLMHAASPPSK